MKSGFTSLILAGLLASAGFATFAQTAATPPSDAMARPPAIAASSARAGMGRDHHLGMRDNMDPSKMDAMVTKHHADMKAKLKITTDQEAAWTTFTTAMKPTGAMDHKRPDRTELDTLSTPERIDKMRSLRTQHMADMTAAMDKRDDATKAFYAVLEADQKKIFDAEHARMGRHHREHRGDEVQRGTGKPAAK